VGLAGIAITLALGVTPLLASRRIDIVQSLREDTVQARGGGGSRGLRAILVTQVAVAVALLVGAALLGRSLAALMAFDTGYDAEGVLSLRVQMAPTAQEAAGGAPPAPTVVATLSALDALRALPGVRQASITSSVPLVDASAGSFVAENMPVVDEANRPRTYVHVVTPGYFETMGVQIVEGRDLEVADLRPDVAAVVVSEGLSRRFWPGQSAIGRRIARGRGGDDARWLTIVGVVEDANWRGIPRNPTADPDIFVPFTGDMSGFAVMLRTDGDPAALLPRTREVLQRALPGMAIYGEQPMRALLDQDLAPFRFLGWLTGWFAAVALALAAIGIYGTLSYWVSRRRAEIAVRSALGATSLGVVRLIVGQAILLVSVGVAGGLLLGRGLGAVLGSVLFGIGPGDSVSFVGAMLVMMMAALAASLVPAIRTARMDPLAALRDKA
jgi:predicted permease